MVGVPIPFFSFFKWTFFFFFLYPFFLVWFFKRNLYMDSLFQNYKLPEKVKHISERSELLSYFVENIKDKNNKSYPARRIAVFLCHLSVPDLYYFKSMCKDVFNRNGQEALNKYFWWSIKARK